MHRNQEKIDNIIYVKVKNIKKIKKSRPTYNIGVEEDESYIHKNVVLHNCRCRYVASMRGL